MSAFCLVRFLENFREPSCLLALVQAAVEVTAQMYDMREKVHARGHAIPEEDPSVCLGHNHLGTCRNTG